MCTSHTAVGAKLTHDRTDGTYNSENTAIYWYGRSQILSKVTAKSNNKRHLRLQQQGSGTGNSQTGTNSASGGWDTSGVRAGGGGGVVGGLDRDGGESGDGDLGELHYK